MVSSSHPLRQASFPPPGGASSPQYSPTRNSSFSPSVSSVGGRGGTSKKRAEPRSTTAASVAKSGANGGKAGSTTREADNGSLRGRDREASEGEEDEADGNDDTVLESGEGIMDEAAKKQEREHLAMLIDAFSTDQADRYDMWRRVRLKKETVRKITNQTLSQSVPASIVTTINGYTKLFIGELVERARDVQCEWLAAKNAGASKEAHRLQEWVNEADVAKLATRDGDAVKKESTGDANTSNGPSPTTPKHPVLQPGVVTAANAMHGFSNTPSGAAAAATITTTPATNGAASTTDDKDEAIKSAVSNSAPYSIDERDRGPLTPDHLREALRRYKKDREGGSAGFQGLSVQGREAAASRVGGKRLFR